MLHMFRKAIEKIQEMKITYALTSDDNMLVNNTKDMIFDLEDEFGDGIIDDYELEMGDINKPKITLTFTKKGDKINTKIKKSLKASGFIK